MPDTASIEQLQPLQAVFERYHVGWDTKDPDMIASLHSADTIFWLHDGSDPVSGREQLRDHCRTLFSTFDFSLEMGRRLYGADHWVFEWMMALSLEEPNGTPFTAQIEMLDVVTVNAAHEVTRKDVYMNGKQAAAAFGRAGIER